MNAEDRRVPSNLELYEKLETMDEKIDKHREYVEDNFVQRWRFDEQTKAMTAEVMRSVTSQLPEMMRDAMTTAAQEIQHNGHADFKAWYEQQVAEDRKERRARIGVVISGVKSAAGLFLMLAAIFNVLLAWWIMTQ